MFLQGNLEMHLQWMVVAIMCGYPVLPAFIKMETLRFQPGSIPQILVTIVMCRTLPFSERMVILQTRFWFGTM